jgi:hypothetical protein
MAAREAQASPPVSENGDAGIIYKDFDNGTLQDAAAAADEQIDWSGWERWLAGHLEIFRQEMIEGMAEGMSMYVSERLDPLKKQLAELKAENVELRSMLGDVLRKYDELSTRAALAHHL